MRYLVLTDIIGDTSKNDSMKQEGSHMISTLPILIGYLLAIYLAYSERECILVRLDACVGTPPNAEGMSS
jgi:hypothetical protein